jgi:Peroxidase, family 2
VGGIGCCGNKFERWLSLDALAAHDKIEHDASLVHDNTPLGAKFAPVNVNWTLVDNLISTYPDGLSITDLAEARVKRESMLRDESRPQLDLVHGEISHGEAALTWLLMKDAKDVVSTETVQQWFGRETFPDSYVIPDDEVTLGKAKKISTKIGDTMTKLKRAFNEF